MGEEFLQFIWKNKLFINKPLTTTDGDYIEVIDSGIQNSNAGPDFFNAKLKIGDTTWAGNVEVHINSSDWLKHNHNNDNAYDNVILQVVLNHDTKIYRSNNELIPTMELKFDPNIFNKYLYFKQNDHWIPCQNEIKNVESFILSYWLTKLTIERLENKLQNIQKYLENNNNHLEEAFYRQLARNFGYKINADPFEWLAKSIPLTILAKHKNDITQLEALMFGQAGFLNESLNDTYYNTLKKEYEFLKHKYKLKPIDKHLWKFLRLRPLNFPTIRISQFTDLIYQSSGLLSKIIEAKSIEEIYSFLQVKASQYWESHYVFGKVSEEKKKPLGESTRNSIIINTIVAFLFVYGDLKDNMKYKNKAIEFLEKTKPENNTTINKWKKLGIKVDNAYTSQALLQLKNEYCDKKNCLQCQIGNNIITN